MRIAKEKPKCRICGKEVARHTGDGSKYCSSRCYGLDNRKPRPNRRVQYERICPQCSKKFLTGGRFQAHKNAKFCSIKCRGLNQSKGIDNYFRINEAGGHARSADWIRLRKRILLRDENKCRSCHKTNCILLVHHIIPRSKNGKHEEDNLITLCNKCHLAIEQLTEIGYKNTNNYRPEKLLKLLNI